MFISKNLISHKMGRNHSCRHNVIFDINYFTKVEETQRIRKSVRQIILDSIEDSFTLNFTFLYFVETGTVVKTRVPFHEITGYDL